MANFFSYKGKLIELHKESLRATMGSQTHEDSLEALRKILISSMRNGETLCVATGKLGMDFKEKWTDEKIFPAHLVFNFKEWRDQDKEIYMPFVKENENHGVGGLNPGHGYICSGDWQMCIVSETDDAETLQTIMGSLPLDQFECLIVA